MLALGQFRRKFYRVYHEFCNKLNRTYPNGSVRQSSTLSSQNVSSFLLIRETRKYIKQKFLTRKIVNLHGVVYANFQRKLDLRTQNSVGNNSTIRERTIAKLYIPLLAFYWKHLNAIRISTRWVINCFTKLLPRKLLIM